MCTDASYYSSQLVGPLINIVIIFIGWLVLYRNAKKIATRSETRGLLDKIIKKVRDLEDQGKVYWLSSPKVMTPEQSTIYTIRMQHDIQILEEYFELISKRNIRVDLSQELFKFRNATTFCSEKVDRAIDVSRVLDISGRANNICSELEEAYILKYRPTG